jgi:hypothetical protein
MISSGDFDFRSAYFDIFHLQPVPDKIFTMSLCEVKSAQLEGNTKLMMRMKYNSVVVLFINLFNVLSQSVCGESRLTDMVMLHTLLEHRMNIPDLMLKSIGT